MKIELTVDMEEIQDTKIPEAAVTRIISSVDQEQETRRSELPVVSPDVSQPDEFPCQINDDDDNDEKKQIFNKSSETMRKHDLNNSKHNSLHEEMKIIENIEEMEKMKIACQANRRIPIGRTLGKVISPGKHRMWHSLSEILARSCRLCDWIPKMCSCIENRSNVSANSRYERLGSAPTLFQYSATMQGSHGANEEPVDSERQAELNFYFGDNTCKRLTVEKNLRIIDLCELLKVNKNSIGNAWSIVETWSELGIERTLEDHEDILATHREMEKFASHHERKFYFLEDFTKYEVFVNPKQFFPREIVAFPNDEDRGPIGDPEDALRRYLARDNTECPEVCSLVWIRHEGSTSWKKLHMLLQGRKLYTTRKGSFLNSKFPRTRLSGLCNTRSSCINQRSLSPDPTPSTSSTINVPSITRLSGRFHHSNNGSTPKRTQYNPQSTDGLLALVHGCAPVVVYVPQVRAPQSREQPSS